MIRLIILITITLLVVIFSIGVLGDNPGYVYIKIHNISIEMSLLLLILLVLTLIVVIHYSWKFLNKLFNSKHDLESWQYRRNLEQSYKQLSKGFIELGSGNYHKAQKILINAAQKTKYSLVPLIGAANAAQQQGDEEMRNFLLNKALEENQDASLSLTLTKADYLMNLGKYNESQEILDKLHKKTKHNALALKIQANIYSRTSQWNKFLPLVPKLQRKTNFNKEEILQLEYQAYRYGLINANDLFSVEKQWKKIPKNMQANKGMLVEYIHKLRANKEYKRASEKLLCMLKKQWDEDLAVLYMELPLDNPAKQINYSEQWLSEKKLSAKLYLTMAKLYIKKGLWVMARDKLKLSLKIESTSEAQELLRKTQIKISEHEEC